MIWKLIASFCVATVITQCLVLGVLASRGNLDSDKAIKMVALANGIDITGDRLSEMLEASKTTPTPSFNEILDQRAETGLDMDLKLNAIADFNEQVQAMLQDLQKRQERFDLRRDAFNNKLAELDQGLQDAGMRELQRTLEVLPPDQAKIQLLKIFEDGEIDTVVNITQGMSSDKTKKILSEFQTPDEQDKLAQILRRIGEGEPKKSLIEDARQDN